MLPFWMCVQEIDLHHIYAKESAVATATQSDVRSLSNSKRSKQFYSKSGSRCNQFDDTQYGAPARKSANFQKKFFLARKQIRQLASAQLDRRKKSTGTAKFNRKVHLEAQ